MISAEFASREYTNNMAWSRHGDERTCAASEVHLAQATVLPLDGDEFLGVVVYRGSHSVVGLESHALPGPRNPPTCKPHSS